MHFPETSLPDADHPWLTPVKGASDLLAIQSLMADGVVNSTFVSQVLAIDLEHPLFSNARCSLLKLVPGLGDHWQDQFLQNLKSSASSPAHELADALIHKTPVRIPKDFVVSLQNLIDVRQAAFESEISKNPRGQILEPGFRVIFPQPEAR